MEIKALINNMWKDNTCFKSVDGRKYTDISLIKNEGIIGFMLDCGRKYYTVSWVKNLIDKIHELGFNALMLHFSEEMGLRIESKLYPWLAGSDDTLCISQGITDVDVGRIWTVEDVAEIVNYAMTKEIEVIPSFDSPAHLNYVVKMYNEHYNADIGNYFHYNNLTRIVGGSGNANYSRGIDVSNDLAVAFIHSLIREYAQLFYNLGCRRFDMGGDELLGWGTTIASSVPRWKQLDHWKLKIQAITQNTDAVAYDMFLYYMNGVYSLLKDIGYKDVFMWNDQALRTYDTDWKQAVTLNKNIVIEYWTNGANNSLNTPLTYMQAGHRILNMLQDYNYFVLKNGYLNPTASTLSDWDKTIYGNYTANMYEMKNYGSMFCVWCDDPTFMTESQVYNSVYPLLCARNEHVPIITQYNTPAELKSTPHWFVIKNTDTNVYYAGNVTNGFGRAYLSNEVLVFAQCTSGILNSWESTDGITWTKIDDNKTHYQTIKTIGGDKNFSFGFAANVETNFVWVETSNNFTIG